MNRFAQLLYGKVIYIYETFLAMSELSTVFSPATFWVDVTGVDCVVGDVVSFQEAVGLVFVRPPSQELSFAEQQAKKLEQFKLSRDLEEIQPILYDGRLFDYDDKARERMRIAEKALVDNGLVSQVWTCADNSQTELTVQDFKGINSLAAQRSGLLHVRYNGLKAQVYALVDGDPEAVEKLNAIVW